MIYALKNTDCAGKSNLRIHWDLRIPLRDGVQLSAILYLPEPLEAPAPTLFTLTPYIAQGYHAQGVFFASHGYPFLSIDVRGRGNSQGDFEPNINEGRDGYDIVEWLAEQTYCTADSSRNARTAHIKLFHDPQRPSVLYVPIGQSQEE